jgi:hypothetical protein
MATAPHRLPHYATTAFSTRRSARTWTVALDGSGNFASISGAVSAATAGDTIVIAPGLYLESLHITKAVHLVGIGDPRFLQDDIDEDEGSYALIMGTGAQTIRWTANGGSIRDLVISHVSLTPDNARTSALLRVQGGTLRVERSILADGAQCGVDCDGGEIVLVRCHICAVNVGVRLRDTAATLERTHVEGADVLALHLEDGATATLTDNSFEGRTILQGTVRSFSGNDIDILLVHGALSISGNRVSTIVHACDDRTEVPVAVSF